MRRRLFSALAALSLLLAASALTLFIRSFNLAKAFVYRSNLGDRILVVCDSGGIGWTTTDKRLTPDGDPDARWSYKSDRPAPPKAPLGAGLVPPIYLYGGIPLFWVAVIALVLPGLRTVQYLRRRKPISN